MLMTLNAGWFGPVREANSRVCVVWPKRPAGSTSDYFLYLVNRLGGLSVRPDDLHDVTLGLDHGASDGEVHAHHAGQAVTQLFIELGLGFLGKRRLTISHHLHGEAW